VVAVGGDGQELTYDAFIGLVNARIPPGKAGLDDGRITRRIYNLFDTDNNGTLSFEEFIFGLNRITKGT
jgi:hypothetical protein